MSREKSKLNLVRQQAAAVGIFSLSELARRVGCSRNSIYLALERPSRFSRVHNRLGKILQGK